MSKTKVAKTRATKVARRSSAETEWVRKGGFDPFWSPWQTKKGQKPVPRELVGVVAGFREMDSAYARKGRDGKVSKSRPVATVECADGSRWTVDCGSAALAPLADFGEGEPVRLVYVGERAVKGRKQKMHDVELYGARS